MRSSTSRFCPTYLTGRHGYKRSPVRMVGSRLFSQDHDDASHDWLSCHLFVHTPDRFTNAEYRIHCRVTRVRPSDPEGFRLSNSGWRETDSRPQSAGQVAHIGTSEIAV